MKLDTYYSYHCDSIITKLDEVPRKGRQLRPGDVVTYDDGCGVIVAVSSKQLEFNVTVLWSVEPDHNRWKVQPLLCKVQPLSAPVGQIFYEDYAYQLKK